MYYKMPSHVKAQWLADLRSGEFEQGVGVLHNPVTGKMCCLGVLCEQAWKAGVVAKYHQKHQDGWTYGSLTEPDDKSSGYLPRAVSVWAGLVKEDYAENNPCGLVSRNDASDEYHWDFAQIADWIEENIGVAE